MDRSKFLCCAAGILLTALPGVLAAAQSAGGGAPENLDERYAQLLVQLGQANLERVQAINHSTPGEIAQQQVQTLQRDLEVAQMVARRTSQGGKLQWFLILLNFADVAASDSQSAWARAARARQIDPNSVSPFDVEILHLRAELARVNLQRGKQLIDAPPDEQQNWALGVLVMEAQRLRGAAPSVY